jgi:molybdate transport system substrate-binding protein
MRGSRVDLVKSPIAVAVRSGAARPSIASEDDVKRAVLAARTIGYSTGPSGDHLLRVFDRWGIAEAVKGRIVQATPGVPVGALVANGDAELGFQQLSELMNVAGIEVLGLLPEAIQGTTIFSGGVATTSTKPDTVRALLSFMASPAVAHVAREHGMEQAG